MTPHSIQAALYQTEKKKKKKRRYEEVDNDIQEKSKSEFKKDRKEKKRQKHDGLSSTFSSLLSTPAESSTAPSKDTSPHPTYTLIPNSISISPSSAVEAEAFLKKHSIKIHTPEGVPRAVPVIEFSQLNVPAELQSAFSGFKEPTPIQACTWPPALEGRDVVGIAETGR